jgi:hypothetical protein
MSVCTQCACFGADGGDCPCDCHDEAVLRCMGLESGQQCKAVATEVGGDTWFCKRHDPVTRKGEPGPEWDEFLK